MAAVPDCPHGGRKQRHRSFHLELADGGGLASYQAGQFLPIRLTLPGRAEPLLRTYTLPDAPNGQSYRISVKREGRGGASDWLHDHAAVGTVIEAMAPRGTFTFTAEARRPAVLISAGIGITPMIAMLNSLLVNEGRTRHHAPLYFCNSRHQAFAGHLRQKTAKHANLTLHVRYSRPAEDDERGRTHDSEGVVDIALLKQVLPFDDYEFYLCGPPPFMQSLYDGLTGLGVRDRRIHFESFGPASVRRLTQAERRDGGGEAVAVTFARSNRTALWRPGAGSLLDVAEEAGLAPLHSCRSGVCGTCATRVLAGSVDYAEAPVHDMAPGEALICCATPHPGPHLTDGTPHREGVTLDL